MQVHLASSKLYIYIYMKTWIYKKDEPGLNVCFRRIFSFIKDNTGKILTILHTLQSVIQFPLEETHIYINLNFLKFKISYSFK